MRKKSKWGVRSIHTCNVCIDEENLAWWKSLKNKSRLINELIRERRENVEKKQLQLFTQENMENSNKWPKEVCKTCWNWSDLTKDCTNTRCQHYPNEKIY